MQDLQNLSKDRTFFMEIVLIPALQPDEKLLQTLAELHSRGMKTLVVDDGSGADYDEIFEKARACGTCVLRLAENRGKGGALKYGMRQLRSLFPDCTGCITADADGQHRTKDILRVQQALRGGAEFVLTVRALRGDIPKTSKLGNTMSRYIYTVLTGHYFRDNQSGLRGFSAAQLPWLCAVPGEKYDYELNMLLYADKQRIPVTTLPIDTVYIDDNASSHFDALHDTVRIYKLLFSQSYPRFLGIALSCLSALALSFFVKGAPYGIAAFCAVLLGGLLEVLLCRFAAFSAVHYRDGWACLLRAALRGGALGGFCALLLWCFPALFPFVAFLLGGALLLPVRYLFHKATRMLPRKPR